MLEVLLLFSKYLWESVNNFNLISDYFQTIVALMTNKSNPWIIIFPWKRRSCRVVHQPDKIPGIAAKTELNSRISGNRGNGLWQNQLPTGCGTCRGEKSKPRHRNFPCMENVDFLHLKSKHLGHSVQCVNRLKGHRTGNALYSKTWIFFRWLGGKQGIAIIGFSVWWWISISAIFPK